MTVMIRALNPKQLQDGLNTVFGLEYKRYPEQWRGFFEVEKSHKAYDEDVLMVGLGAAQVKSEANGVAYDSGGESWVARYVNQTIALAFSLSEEAEEDNLYGSLGSKYSKALARSMQHTKEVKGAAVYNNGFDPLYVGGDGVALFSTAHPLWSGGFLSNMLPTPADLSETALEDAMIRISLFEDDRGIPMMVQAKSLGVHPSNVFEASRILKTSGRVGTSDNDINALKDGGYLPGGVKQNHRFTDPDAWFLMTDCPDGLKHKKRIALKRGIEGDFETGNMRYKARERYTFGHTDPRGAFGSQGGGG